MSGFYRKYFFMVKDGIIERIAYKKYFLGSEILEK